VAVLANQQPSVSIIVLNINGTNDLRRCLDSIDRLSYANREVIVVDNGSTDGSQDMVRLEFPWVHLIDMKQNMGYGGGNNEGARVSRGSFLFFLNNDIILTSGCLDELIAASIRCPDCGILGCKVFYCDEAHTLQHTGGILHRSGSGIMLGQFEDDMGQYDKERRVDWVVGAAWLVRREAFRRVGGFDLIYHPIYHDEIDLSYSACRLGYNTLYCPQSVIYHCEDLEGKAASLRRAYLRYRNKTIFMMKHFGLMGALKSLRYELEYLRIRRRKHKNRKTLTLSVHLTILSIALTAIWIARYFPEIYKRVRRWSRI
jgi:GT2 family glycosyltransferase